MNVRLALITFALSASAVLAGSAAVAQSGSNEATRRDLIQQAQSSSEAGHHDQALDLAQRAASIRMSPPLRRLIAEQQEALGQFGDAMASAQACVHENEADASVPGRRGHIAACNAIIQRAQQRVGHVVVHMPASPPAGVTVHVAGADLASALWGVPYVVNSGHVVVEVTASGYETFHNEVDVGAGASVDVNVELHAAAARSSSSSTSTASSTGSSTHPAGGSSRSGGGGGMSPLVPVAAILAVLGVGGVVMGAATDVIYIGDANRFNNAGCYISGGTVMGGNGSVDCSSTRSSAATMQMLSIVGYVAGGVLLVAGVGLFVASRLGSHADHPPASSARAMCAPRLDAPGVDCMVVF